MGKKKQSSGIGRAIIKDRFGKQNKTDGDTFLHTSELNDGYDWGRLNLQSVTEQNNLEDFLATAELAGTEFTAEKLNITFVSKETSGLPQADELDTIKGLHKQHEELLRIPRRHLGGMGHLPVTFLVLNIFKAYIKPHWTKEMSALEVDQNEKVAFLEWRRSLAKLQEVEGLVMTPYEKNLDFWRQLWRVIEKSDIVVQIVDARNPLLFYCPDLESYITEVDKSKQCILLMNKADFLNEEQRNLWADHFTKLGVKIAFWSALDETKRQEELAQAALENIEENMNETESSDDDDNDKDEENIDTEDTEKTDNVDNTESTGNDKTKNNIEIDNVGRQTNMVTSTCECKRTSSSLENMDSVCDKTGGSSSGATDKCVNCRSKRSGHIKNTAYMYTGQELLDFFKSLSSWKKEEDSLTTVGMVGYPNVGKSSTINAILKLKKVPVSATPGRTKHFQTLFVEPTLMLCDCPGLVFPSFVTTKADLVVSGILPIDQMRDHVPPASLVCRHIPRGTLEKMYGIIIPKPVEGEDPYRDPTSYELLNAYGAIRGFMTQRGAPDCPRASRFILKDYVNGKLLYCHPPPGVDAIKFNRFVESEDTESTELQASGVDNLGNSSVPTPSKIDKDFFRKEFSTVHSRTARSGAVDAEGNSVSSPQSSQAALNEKPWKKHHNKGKKEKLRRVYGYLDS